MIVILLRHAESQGNRDGLAIGKHPGGLTAKGKRQALKMAEELKVYQSPHFYSSPMTRCLETAHIVSRSQFSTEEVSPLLMERDLGPFEGTPIDILAAKRKELEHQFLDPTQDWEGVEGVEQDVEVFARFQNFISKLNVSAESTLILVTHAGFMKSVISELLSIPARRSAILKLPNCSGSVLESYQKGWQIRQLSVTSGFYE